MREVNFPLIKDVRLLGSLLYLVHIYPGYSSVSSDLTVTNEENTPVKKIVYGNTRCVVSSMSLIDK